MAGQPKKKQMMARIEESAEQIKALVAAGKTLKEMQAETGFAFQRIHEWLKLPANEGWYASAKKAKATMLADESLAILDQATRDSIPMDRERARSRQWMAERLDPEGWGQPKAPPAVQIDVAAAFIQVMREANEAQKQAKAAVLRG